ncbi:DUF5658 family protein [Chloroflexota bacterium]
MAVTGINKMAGIYSPTTAQSGFLTGLPVIKISYVLMHLIDLALTLYAVNIGYHELNPFIRSMIDNPLQLVLIKVIIPALLAWLVPAKLLLPALAVITLVVGWNIGELLSIF